MARFSVIGVIAFCAVALPFHPAYGQAGDPNGDGIVDFADFGVVKTLPDLVELHRQLDIPRGDVQGEGVVSFPSFLTVAANFGSQAQGYLDGDFNLDGGVDIEDYAILATNFGTTGYRPDPPRRAPGNISARLESGHIVIFGNAEIGGLEIGSALGNLRPLPPEGQQPAPFSFLLSNRPTSVTFGSLGDSVTLAGDLVTQVGYEARDPREDFFVRWFEPGSYEVFSNPPGARLPIGPEPPAPESICNANTTFADLVSATNRADLLQLHACLDIPRGDFDGGGSTTLRDFLELVTNYSGGRATAQDAAMRGYVDGDANLDGLANFTDFAILARNFGNNSYQPEIARRRDVDLIPSLGSDNHLAIETESPVQIGGLEFVSENGDLIPLPRSGTSEHFSLLLEGNAHFEFLLENNEHVVALGNLGSNIVLDGQLVTGVRAKPGTLPGDLRVNWFESGSPHVFSDPFFDPNPPPPELVECNGVTVGVGNLNAAENEGELIALHQCLDVPRGDVDGTGEVDSLDYLTLVERYRRGDEYAKGDLNVDGTVNLRDYTILSQNHGETSYQQELPTKTPSDISAFVNDEGQIVVSAESAVEIIAVEFSSQDGNLVPLFPGDLTAAPVEPFALLLENDKHRVAFQAALGSHVILAGDLVTNVEVARDVTFDDDLNFRWAELGSYQVFAQRFDPLPGDLNDDGVVEFVDFLLLSSNFGRDVGSLAEGDIDGNGVVAFPDFLVLSVNFGRDAVAAQAIPEPSCLGMLGLGCLLLGGMARRSRRH